MFGIVVSLLLISLAPAINAEFLRVSGKNLLYGKDKIFLSGANIAWECYGCDFGNNRYDKGSRAALENSIRRISAAGGNSLRIWIHVEGETNPTFNSGGYVTGTDGANTLISDLSKFLDYAAQYNILVIPVLWNGARIKQQNLINLVWDDSKLDSYIKTVLRPMVRALSKKPALAAWEIMNEPEGAIKTEKHSNPCYDASRLSNTGAGWAGAQISMERMMIFVARQAAAIHQEDRKALVTVGSFSERPQTDAFEDSFNYYKDKCLTRAGKSPDAKIDFYQIHTYAYQRQWSKHSPFKVTAQDYKLDKPLIIGEFSSSCSAGEPVEKLYDHVYNNGYNGAWVWQYNGGGECSDDPDTEDRGIQQIRGKNQNGVVAIRVR